MADGLLAAGVAVADGDFLITQQGLGFHVPGCIVHDGTHTDKANRQFVIWLFKTPRKIVFGPLPKTSTGKIQKFELRERAKSL